jgi:GPI inositol-deacylase
MGGAVARATFLAPNYKKGSVNTILTLSAPHNAGPLMTERAVASFYAKVNSYWRKSLERNSTDPDLREVAVLSLAGGFRDVQVSAELSSLEEIAPPSHQVSVLSTSIPHVWLSVDHLVRSPDAAAAEKPAFKLISYLI